MRTGSLPSKLYSPSFEDKPQSASKISAFDLWLPGHFELGFFTSRIVRSEMDSTALGFSYVGRKSRNR